MPNLLRVTGDPLSARNIERVRVELEQTAVAVSVVGTSKQRIAQLIDLVEPIAEALVGARSEVNRLRGRLRRSMHNLRVSNLSQRHASEKMRALVGAVSYVGEAVKVGIGNAEPSFEVDGFFVINVWGYNESELRLTVSTLKRAAKELDAVGLAPAISVELSGGGSKFATYLRDRDGLDLDPTRAASMGELFEAIGEGFWVRDFRSEDRETWGGRLSVRKFTDAFGKALTGWKLDAETVARLQMTVGRFAADWPEVAA